MGFELVAVTDRVKRGMSNRAFDGGICVDSFEVIVYGYDGFLDNAGKSIVHLTFAVMECCADYLHRPGR